MLEKINLKIETPAGPIPSGRGFYQLDEEILFVQIGLFLNSRKFYSYLETDNLLLDIDQNGRLIFIELDLSRRSWIVYQNLRIPKIIEPADIQWYNFRDKINPPKIITNNKKNIMKIEFSANSNPLYYHLADKVIVESNELKILTAFWVVDIIDDFAGHEIRDFRKKKRLDKSYFI
jgi:hypothetical protein